VDKGEYRSLTINNKPIGTTPLNQSSVQAMPRAVDAAAPRATAVASTTSDQFQVLRGTQPGTYTPPNTNSAIKPRDPSEFNNLGEYALYRIDLALYEMPRPPSSSTNDRSPPSPA
jgi:hypothetical protein